MSDFSKLFAGEFTNPSREYRGKPFWAWNDELKEDALREQIRIFKEMGFGGYFMHSRVGLKTEYLGKEWFDLIKACIDEAKKTDTEAWLYDEDRWPSGPAGGLVTKDPRYRARQLQAISFGNGQALQLPEDTERHWLFAVELEDKKLCTYRTLKDCNELKDGEQGIAFAVTTWPCVSWFNGYTYLDTMSEEAVAAFVESTHERYRQEVGEYFGNVIPGMFTDEPFHGPIFQKWWISTKATTWTPKLPEKFQEMFGYDLGDYLPEVFFNDVNGTISKARHHYHICATRLFVDAYSKQIGQWCEDNHLIHTGHVVEEWPLSSQASCDGSAMQFYQHMQAPGIDILTEHREELVTAKQASSVARQMGRKWVLSELYGCTGWDTTFEAYKYLGDWQAVLGITLRCPHLSWYSMAGEAKRDYPASIHFHSSWWKRYHIIEDYFSRLNVMLTTGKPVCELAVIHPIESFSVNLHQNMTRSDIDSFHSTVEQSLQEMNDFYEGFIADLLGVQFDFDFADEAMMVDLNTAIEDSSQGPLLTIGQMKYKAILVPPLHTLRRTTLEILKTFANAGGTVFFMNNAPDYLDGERSDDAKHFAAARMIGSDISSVKNALQNKIGRIKISSENSHGFPDVLYQLREDKGNYILFLVNKNRQKAYSDLRVSVKKDKAAIHQVQLWDAFTSARYDLDFSSDHESVSFTIDLDSSGSALIVLATQSEDLPAFKRLRATDKGLQINPAQWFYERDDHNVLLLDRCDCYAETKSGGTFEMRNREILELDARLRDWLGIQRRGGDMIQPWMDKESPLGPTAHVMLVYQFKVDEVPAGPVYLAVEQPQRWTITLNDEVIQFDDSGQWWVDPCLKKIPLPTKAIKSGQNQLVLQGQFDRKADLEMMYLLGDFGATVDGMKSIVTRLPETLQTGSWTKQNLAFYSGNIVYKTEFEYAPVDHKYYLLKFTNSKATAIEVVLNGKYMGMLFHGCWETNITEGLVAGTNTIEIKVYGSRRNAFGPFHMNEIPKAYGPGEFQRINNCHRWTDDLQVVDYGLLEPPLILEAEPHES